jgi:phage-related protein (TIGR01555 family)
VGQKICTSRPDDMVRAWITFPGDTDGKILKALDQLEVRTKVRDLLYWTELYRGGALVLGGLDSSLDMEEPAKITNKSQIKWIKVYTASQIMNDQSDLVSNVNSEYFEDWDVLRIHRKFAPDGAGEARVHRSRCILSKGIPMPRDRESVYEFKYYYWDISRLQAVFNELGNSATAQKSFGNLIHEATIALMKMEGLGEILANEDTAAASLKSVMDSIARSKSVLNMVLTGPNDSLTRDTLNTSGWQEVANLFRQEVAAAANSTVPRLYGIPSSGLGGGGADEAAKKNYDDSIQADQETRLRPILQQIVRFVAPSVGMDPEEPFKFNPLNTPTAKETAEIREIHSRTWKNYVDMGSLDPVFDVRESVFGGDSYSTEIVLDPSLSEEDLNPEPPAPVSAPKGKVPAPKGKVPSIPMPKAPTPPAKGK